MNQIKLDTLTLIKNSSINTEEKDRFIQLVTDLSENSCSQLFLEMKKEGVDRIWQSIQKKHHLLRVLENCNFLKEDQKKNMKRVIMEEMDLDDLKKIMRDDIDIKKEKEKMLATYEKIKNETEKIRDETEELVDRFIEKIKKKAIEDLINEI